MPDLFNSYALQSLMQGHHGAWASLGSDLQTCALAQTCSVCQLLFGPL